MRSSGNLHHRPCKSRGSGKAYRDPDVPRRTHLPPFARLRGARKVLRIAASGRLNLDTVAFVSGVSRDHLLRLFRQCGEASPMRQVRRMQLEQVVERLRSTGDSVEALAQEFHYADGSSLRRALRRAFGRSPNELRRGPDAG